MREEWMTPKRRVLSGMYQGRVDRIPVINPTSVVTVELQAELDVHFPEAHTDARKMAALSAGGYEVYGFDSIMPYFSVHMGSAILGCEIDWGTPEDMPDAVTHPYKSDEDIEVPTEEELLKVYTVRALVDAIKILREKYPHVAIIGKVMGPWTLGYNGFGVQDFLMQTILEPEMIKRSLDKLEEISIMFANLQVKAGADVICYPDHATGDLVSPEMYNEFLTERHKKITKLIGAPTILHICGNTLKRSRWFAEEGFDAFHYDTKTDLVELKKVTGKNISLTGGISNVNSLLQGTPEQVKEETKWAAKNGVDLLSPECAIPLLVPIKNLKAIVEAAKEI